MERDPRDIASVQQLGVREKRIAMDGQVTGYALEIFCGMEILKHQSWATEHSTLRHYRVHDDETEYTT